MSKIEGYSVDSEGWCRYRDSELVWRFNPEHNNALEIQGQGFPRTSGAPISALSNWCDEKSNILAACERFPAVRPELVLALMLVEAWPPVGPDNQRSPINHLHEPGYISDEETPDEVSYGKGHTLLATARAMEAKHNLFPAARAPRVHKWHLNQPSRSIAYMVAYMDQLILDNGTDDLILLRGAYNCGRVKYGARDVGGANNPFRVKTNRTHTLWSNVKFYNDFMLGVEWTRTLGVWP